MPNKRSFLLFLILSTAFLIYSPSLKNNFIWDDFHLIVNEPNIRSFEKLPVAFKTHLFQNVGGSNFYRPVQTISFMLDYAIWRLNPFGYHLTNILFHLLNVILVYFFVSRIFKNPDIALLTSLIFAIHPINTEALAYISGRADPLSVFLFLSALLCYIRFKDGDKKPLFFFSLLLFTVSLLTKEAVLIFPLILILYDSMILGQKSVSARSAKSYAPYFFIILCYVFYRLFALGLPLGVSGRISLKTFLLTTPKILILYLWLFFFPIKLHMERFEPITSSIFSPQAIVSLVTITCMIWLALIYYRRSKGVFFCIGFFIITLLPMLNILRINAPMAEHWVYLPSIGIYSIISLGIAKVIDFKKPTLRQPFLPKLATLILIVFLGFFSVRTVVRNMEWGNPLEFYKNLLKNNPNSARAHLNVASIYVSADDLKSARQEFRKAIELSPTHPLCYYGLGFLDYLENNKAGAIRNWKIALDIAPFYQPPREAMNKVLYTENKRFRKLVKVIRANPKNIMANFRLAKLYLENSLYIEALDKLERILETDPEDFNALFNRAGIYSRLGLYEKAIAEYKKLLIMAPDNPRVYHNLAICYTSLNKLKESKVMQQREAELQKK